MTDSRVERFVQARSVVEQALQSNNVEFAFASFNQLFSAYQELLSSSIDNLHKSIAYSETMKLRSRVDALLKVQQSSSVVLPSKVVFSPKSFSSAQAQSSVNNAFPFQSSSFRVSPPLIPSPSSHPSLAPPEVPLNPSPFSSVPSFLPSPSSASQSFSQSSYAVPVPLPIPSANSAPSFRSSNRSSKSFSTRDYAILSFLGLLLAFVVLFQPSFVGLVVGDAGTAGNLRTIALNIDAVGSFSQNVQFIKPPTSIRVSGILEGDGDYRIWLKTPEKNFLLAEKLSKDSQLKLDRFCSDACDISALQSRNGIIFGEGNSNVRVSLSVLEYSFNALSNHAPQFSGSRELEIPLAKTTAVDLSTLFSDGDGDSLSYLVASPEGISSRINGTFALLSAEKSGEAEITFIATDGLNVTRIPVLVKVS